MVAFSQMVSACLWIYFNLLDGVLSSSFVGEILPGVAPPGLASFSAYPALPRWANLCRASSAGVTLCCHLRILHENGQSKIRTRAGRANGAPSNSISDVNPSQKTGAGFRDRLFHGLS